MDTSKVTKLTKSFDAVVQQIPNGTTEFWFARDLQDLPGYSEWRNFLKVIEKAKYSAHSVGATVQNHFVDVNKMVQIGSGAGRPIEDVMLTRYACYLVAQNGDPRKEAIAFAQTYFADPSGGDDTYIRE